MSSFAQLALSESILQGIAELGFETPTPVQAAVIPALLKGDRNLIALAQTGTGKTAAFGLPILEKVTLGEKHVQAVILCPTRELCLQVCRDIRSFAKHLNDLQVAAVYGGASISGQIRSLKMGSHILVATPGRLHDLLRRKAADLSNANCVVLDEADEMLGMGFEEDLRAIMGAIPVNVQKLLFSATMPNSLSALVHAFVKDPLEIAIGARGSGAETVEHHVYVISEKNRYEALKRIVDESPDIYGLIFCRTRIETQDVANALVRDGFRADALHGDLSQMQRDRVMKSFRERKLKLLVATNVAARGLDVSELDHVISFRLPDELSGYTHRSGRTGRAGREGISSVLITPRERSKIPYIERSLGCRFLLQTIPDGKTVCSARIASWLEKVRYDEAATERIAPFASGILAQLESIPRDELVTRLLSAQFADLLEYYRTAPDLNVEVPARSGGRDDRGGKSGGRRPRREKSPRADAAESSRRTRKPKRFPDRRDSIAHKPKKKVGDSSPAKRKKSTAAPVPAGPAKAKAVRTRRDDNTPDWVRKAMQGGKKSGNKGKKKKRKT